MVKVYLKSEDEPKDNKIKCKNLNLAWVHIENQEYLNELYNLGFIYFDIIGKKDNILGFEFTTKNFKKTYYDISSKYFNFLKDICEKFIYVEFSSDYGEFVEFIKYYLNDKKSDCALIKIKVIFKNNDYVKSNYYDVGISKKDYLNLQLKEGMKIPIKRKMNIDTENIVVDYLKFIELYENKLNKNIDLDFGIIDKIEIEYHNYFKENLYTIYYNYKGSSGNKFSILNYCKMDFNICKFKIGDKIYLKLNDKGFRIWDNKKQIEILKQINSA